MLENFKTSRSICCASDSGPTGPIPTHVAYKQCNVLKSLKSGLLGLGSESADVARVGNTF